MSEADFVVACLVVEPATAISLARTVDGVSLGHTCRGRHRELILRV
jgi:hypothetical protein